MFSWAESTWGNIWVTELFFNFILLMSMELETFSRDRKWNLTHAFQLLFTHLRMVYSIKPGLSLLIELPFTFFLQDKIDFFFG